MPFVQGKLWQKYFQVTVKTMCAHSKQPIEIVFDNHLNYEVLKGSEPLVFEPHVDWANFTEPNIIHAF